jgi:putative DNA primase/helicase
MERNEPPRWMQDKHFNEVLFCEDFLSAHPMVCVDGSFFTVEGRVADEEGIRKQIYEMLRPHFTSGTARRATTLLETLRLEAYTQELPIQEDRIHVANGTLFLNGEFRAEKEFCRNRLPVNYDPTAPQPVTWLRFLSDLLEAEDILTLQEYLGYRVSQRTHQGEIRQQSRRGHVPQPPEFPSGDAAAQIPRRGGKADCGSRLPHAVGQRARGGGAGDGQPGVLQG